MRKILPSLALAALSVYASGCGGEGPAVARLEVTPRTLRLAYPEMQAVHLNWRPSAALGDATVQPMVFLHLRDKDNQVVRTFDHPFPQKWREGTPVAYDAKIFQSVLATPLSPGTYKLTVGLYEAKKRWALDGLGEKIDRDEYQAAEVEVPAGSAGPSFAFTPTWMPIEDGGDKYVVARRWLVGNGAIGLRDLHETGTLWLLVRIPNGHEGTDQKLEVQGPTGVPGLLVRGSCGGFEVNVSGPGMHEIEVPVDTPPPTGVCRVGFVANFTLTSTTTGQQRSLSLENAAWLPGAAHRSPASPPAATPAASP